jgi:hypothetical protein
MTISNKGVHLNSGFYSDHDLLKLVVKIKEKKSPTVDYPWLFSEYDNILGHRETGAKKTCPGSKIDMDAFRALFFMLLPEDK